jgi:mannosyltransferase OCH1-like enzyme
MFYIIVGSTIIVILVFVLYNINSKNNNSIYNLVNNNSNNNSNNNNKQEIIDYQELSNDIQQIPKIIIQTWKTQTVPQRYIPLIDSVKKNNPDYQYLFFTDDDIINFFKLYYPQYLSTYFNLPIVIQRIDFFRYVAIYHYGGFYLDLDMSVFKSFNSLLDNSCIFPVDEYIDIRLCKYIRYKEFCDKSQNFLLGQYAFAASPKHPFIKLLIENIHNNVNKYIKYVDFDSEDYIYKTTGPDFVTKIYMNYNNKSTIKILDIGRRQYFGDYAKHNYFGTWK